jgi:hypothetical protein
MLPLQLTPIANLLQLAEQRMNDELLLFLTQWRRSLEMTSGTARLCIEFGHATL